MSKCGQEKKTARQPLPAPEKTCVQCGTVNCYRRDKKFPAFCLTENAEPQEIAYSVELYKGKGLDARLARAAAEVEGRYYGKLTRAEEIVAFARGLGITKIGIATCLGLIEESRIFARVLEANGLTAMAVVCKVGAADKTKIGIDEKLKVKPGCHESLCNPVLQATLLNKWKTELNVMVGLCVGHDALFTRHSTAPMTTLITKDRVLGHNPAAALYGANFYYRRLLHPQEGLLAE